MSANNTLDRAVVLDVPGVWVVVRTVQVSCGCIQGRRLLLLAGRDRPTSLEEVVK